MRFIFALFLILGLPFLTFGQDSAYVQISIPVACMRAAPAHSAELVSQSILGTPMKVMEREGEWWKLQGPDGYEGFVNQSGFVSLSDDELNVWKDAPRLRVISLDEARVLSAPYPDSKRNTVTTLVNGSIIMDGGERMNGYIKIILPDGREGYIPATDVEKLESDSVLSTDSIISDCYYLLGTPYLWGGCSTKSMDCSGLVRIAYLNGGILLPRDAKDQYQCGNPVEGELQAGDLLFFSSSPEGGITHVALYDDDNRYIHCSGMVKTSRMDADDPDFSKRYYRGVRRIVSDDFSTDTFLITNHPWYFKQNSNKPQ